MTDAELLAKAKEHLRIDAAYTGDDDYISGLLDVAKAAVKWQIDAAPAENVATDTIGADETYDEPTPAEYDPTPAELHAVLLLTAELYAHREITGVNDKSLPKSYYYLIGTLRRYTVA